MRLRLDDDTQWRIAKLHTKHKHKLLILHRLWWLYVCVLSSFISNFCYSCSSIAKKSYTCVWHKKKQQMCVQQIPLLGYCTGQARAFTSTTNLDFFCSLLCKNFVIHNWKSNQSYRMKRKKSKENYFQSIFNIVDIRIFCWANLFKPKWVRKVWNKWS